MAARRSIPDPISSKLFKKTISAPDCVRAAATEPILLPPMRRPELVTSGNSGNVIQKVRHLRANALHRLRASINRKRQAVASGQQILGDKLQITDMVALDSRLEDQHVKTAGRHCIHV